MKVVILAGGLGTRLSEETQVKPKPMAEIGDRPMLWHIMRTYSHYGYQEFVICLGYKGYVIKEYFANYILHSSDVTLDLRAQQTEVHDASVEPWRVTLVETGAETQTGGRLKRVARYLRNETFMMTYGDGVGDVDVAALVRYHRKHGKTATMTTVQPLGRFGAVAIGPDGASITAFSEKPKGDGGWVNGGFFVLEPSVLDLIRDDTTVFEREPLETLARDGELRAFKHAGFWHPMDVMRDKTLLDQLWRSGSAPWKVW